MATKRTKTSSQGSGEPASKRDGDALLLLVAAGDNHAARLAARARTATSCTDDERRAAEEILLRTGFDPGALLVGLVGVTLVLGIIWLLFAG